MSHSDSQHLPEPTAHEELFSKPSEEVVSPTLGQFTPTLPTPANNLEEDLTADPMDQQALTDEFSRVREGSTVTINTAYQGTVTEMSSTDPEEIGIESTSQTNFHFNSFKLETHNEDAPSHIQVWEDGTTYDDNYRIGYVVPDGTHVDIKHIAVSNEMNLLDDVVADRYRAFRPYEGGEAIRMTNSSINLLSISEVRDGIVVFDDSSRRRPETDMLVDGTETGKATYLLQPTRHTDADRPTVLLGAENPLTTDDSISTPVEKAHEIELTSLPVAQQSVLSQIADLPESVYTLSERGLMKGVPVAGSDVVSLAFPHADLNELPADNLEPSGSAAAGLSSPITSITGIGKQTAADLSNIRGRWMKTKRQLENSLEDCEYVESVEPSRQDELEAAQEDFDPPDQTRIRRVNSIREFIDRGARVFNVSDQYMPDAIGDLRATVAEHADDRLTQLFLIHAGATRGHLYDTDGNHLGHIAQAMIGAIDLDNVTIGGSISHIPSYVDDDESVPDPPLPTPGRNHDTEDCIDRLHIFSRDGTFDEGTIEAPNTPQDFPTATNTNTTVKSSDPYRSEWVYSTLPPVENTTPNEKTDKIPTFRTALHTNDAAAFKITSQVAQFIAELLNCDMEDPVNSTASITVADGAGVTVSATPPKTSTQVSYTVSEPVEPDESEN